MQIGPARPNDGVADRDGEEGFAPTSLLPHRIQRWISPDSSRRCLKDQAAVFGSGLSSFLLVLGMLSRNALTGVLPFIPRPWCGRLVL